MSEQSVLHRIEHFGYYLLPKSRPGSLGYSGLIVAIRPKPTEAHFDPESIRLLLCNKDNLSSWETLKLTSHVLKSLSVCPGQVTLADRKDKRVNFFNFGGSLETITFDDERIYVLHSPAPILEITRDRESFPDQFAFEVEALQAKLHAKWGRDDDGFAERLAQIEPFQLYLACLYSIHLYYGSSRPLRKSWPGFYGKLQQETEWLRRAGQWSANLATLEELLEPN